LETNDRPTVLRALTVIWPTSHVTSSPIALLRLEDVPVLLDGVVKTAQIRFVHLYQKERIDHRELEKRANVMKDGRVSTATSAIPIMSVTPWFREAKAACATKVVW
jgi:hypothetical protein